MLKRRSGRCKTIGPAEIPKPDPNNYLRSHAALNLHKNFNPVDKKNICQSRKPPIPDFHQLKSTEKPIKLNMVSRNKLLALLSEAKKPSPYVVDTRNGNKYNLIGSGLTNYYVYKDVSAVFLVNTCLCRISGKYRVICSSEKERNMKLISFIQSTLKKLLCIIKYQDYLKRNERSFSQI